MWNGIIRRWFWKTLFETIPTYLAAMLEGYIRRDGHSKTLLTLSLSGGIINTYDLLNCGPDNRFAMGKLISHNSDDYGSGVPKKFKTLRLTGADVTFAQIQDIQDRMNIAYRGKKLFGEKLKLELQRNKYILDAFGFPVPVCEEKQRDSCNRVVQRSGHLTLVLLIYMVVREFWRNRIRYDWLIVDYHDETDPIVDVRDIPLATQIFKEAVRTINEDILQAKIPLKAEPQVAVSLAEVKCDNVKYDGDDEDLIEILEDLGAL